jgi:hypothetical protein
MTTFLPCDVLPPARLDPLRLAAVRLEFKSRASLRGERDHAQAPRWSETTVLTSADPRFAALGNAVEQMAKAEKAGAGTALVSGAGGGIGPGW